MRSRYACEAGWHDQDSKDAFNNASNPACDVNMEICHITQIDRTHYNHTTPDSTRQPCSRSCHTRSANTCKQATDRQLAK
jgi:hypothetical protein